MRYLFVFLLLVVAFIGSIVSAIVVVQERDYSLRGYVDPVQDADLPYALPRLGLNVELFQYSSQELSEQLDSMARLDVIWLRQLISWREIEVAPGIFDWNRLDIIVDVVNNYPDFELIPVFVEPPEWVQMPDADSVTAPPVEPEHLADFVSEFAKRYGFVIDYYQIWDEPNLDDAWGGNNPKPVEYAAILEASYHAIHSADPGATVLAAALAPTIEIGPENISDILYLQELYQLGIEDFSDGIAAKPYGFDTSPTEDRCVDNKILNFSRIVALREVMEDYGDGTTPLWASNWGWNALPSDWSGKPSIWGNVSQSEQAEYTKAALARVEREFPWLGGMILHHWQPEVPTNDATWGFAVINQNNEPGMLFSALETYEPPSSARNGLFHPITPFAQYSGVWTFGNLGADIGWLETSDSQLVFDFYGQDIALRLREGDYVAFLYPSVDEAPANAVPHDTNGNAYLFLRSATLDSVDSLIPIARNLPEEEHKLRIVTDKGWDQWALAGYVVSSGDLREPYNQQIVMAWLTAVVAGIGTVWMGTRIPWLTLIPSTRVLLARIDDTQQFVISILTSVALMLSLLVTFGDGTPNIFRRDAFQLGVLIVVSGGLLALEPGIIVTLISVMVLFVFIYNKPEYGLLLTLFYAPFFLFPVDLYRFAFPMAELIILVTTGAWVLKLFVLLGRQRQSSNTDYAIFFIPNFASMHPLDYGMVVWVTLGAISISWAEWRGVAITEFRTMVLEPALFYIIFRSLSFNKIHIRKLVDALLLAGIMVALIGFVLYVRGDAIITAEEGALRLASVYGSPNNVGLFLGRCIPFALAYLLIPVNRYRRWMSGLALVLMLLAVALTVSVGAILIGLPVGVATVLLVVWGKHARLLLLGLGIVGAGVVAILVNVSARFASLLDISQGTNFIRLRVWESAINMVRDNPIFGLGLDQFLYAYRGHYIRPDAIWDRDLSHPHNFLLDFWIRLGVLGVLLFFYVQYHFWSAMLKFTRAIRYIDPLLFAISVGAIGSMANLLAHGLIDNSVFVLDLSFVFVFLVGIAANLSNMQAIDAA